MFDDHVTGLEAALQPFITSKYSRNIAKRILYFLSNQIGDIDIGGDRGIVMSGGVGSGKTTTLLAVHDYVLDYVLNRESNVTNNNNISEHRNGKFSCECVLLDCSNASILNRGQFEAALLDKVSMVRNSLLTPNISPVLLLVDNIDVLPNMKEEHSTWSLSPASVAAALIELIDSEYGMWYSHRDNSTENHCHIVKSQGSFLAPHTFPGIFVVATCTNSLHVNQSFLQPYRLGPIVNSVDAPSLENRYRILIDAMINQPIYLFPSCGWKCTQESCKVCDRIAEPMYYLKVIDDLFPNKLATVDADQGNPRCVVLEKLAAEIAHSTQNWSEAELLTSLYSTLLLASINVSNKSSIATGATTIISKFSRKKASSLFRDFGGDKGIMDFVQTFPLPVCSNSNALLINRPIHRLHAIEDIQLKLLELVDSSMSAQLQDDDNLFSGQKLSKWNCSGIVLHGPSGSGKTALAMWLGFALSSSAHRAHILSHIEKSLPRNNGTVVDKASSKRRPGFDKISSSTPNCKFLVVPCADLVHKVVGEAEQRIAKIFAAARKLAPCLILLDNLDMLLTGDRCGGNSSRTRHQAVDRLLSTLLVEIDGLKKHRQEQQLLLGSSKMETKIYSAVSQSLRNFAGGSRVNGTPDAPIIVMATVLSTHSLDRALIRPGRLEHHIQLTLPSAKDVASYATCLILEMLKQDLKRLELERNSIFGTSNVNDASLPRTSALQAAILADITDGARRSLEDVCTRFSQEIAGTESVVAPEPSIRFEARSYGDILVAYQEAALEWAKFLQNENGVELSEIMGSKQQPDVTDRFSCSDAESCCVLSDNNLLPDLMSKINRELSDVFERINHLLSSANCHHRHCAAARSHLKSLQCVRCKLLFILSRLRKSCV